ncbi:MAG: hypothetical protein R3C18_01875 [Planctomycetaceae bacterium]
MTIRLSQIATAVGLTSLFVSQFSGCDIAADLDRRTEPTLLYVAEFQGLDYRSRDELSNLGSTLAGHKDKQDIDGMGQTMQSLGLKYMAISEQVLRLDTKNVDEDAVSYVKEFAALYEEIGNAHQEAATNISERDIAKLEALKPHLASLTKRIEDMRSDRTTLFTTLTDRYGGRDFNSVDY